MRVSAEPYPLKRVHKFVSEEELDQVLAVQASNALRKAQSSIDNSKPQ